MALSDAWPAQSGVVDQIELRKNLAGLIIRDTSGNPRPGVFPRHNNALVAATATMNVAVAAFEAALVRAGGPIFVSNDGTVNVLLAAAPASNSRIDVVYVRQNEDGYGGLADGSNSTVFGVAQGTAAASPTVPAIPAGALALAQVQIPSTATATNSSGVVITQVFTYSATTGGAVLARSYAELAGFAASPGTRGSVFADTTTLFNGEWRWNPSTSAWNKVGQFETEIDLPDGSYANLAQIGASLVLPALPHAYRIDMLAVGVIGASGTSGGTYGLNLVSSAGTLTDTQGNTQVQVVNSPQWAGYSHTARIDLPANVATSLSVTMSTPSTAGHFKGRCIVRLLFPGEY